MKIFSPIYIFLTYYTRYCQRKIFHSIAFSLSYY